MALERTFTLVVKYEGAYEQQASDYNPGIAGTAKGAGEASKRLEKAIRTMVYTASNTTVKVESLTRV